MKDDELLDKYKTWGKVKNSIKKEFDSEPVYSKKYLKAKIILYWKNLQTFAIIKYLMKVLNLFIYQ